MVKPAPARRGERTRRVLNTTDSENPLKKLKTKADGSGFGCHPNHARPSMLYLAQLNEVLLACVCVCLCVCVHRS
jgi:hypothetical protein